MTSVAEIVAKSHREVGYVLFLEGVPFAFTNRSELVGGGGFSWIADEDRIVLEGLTVPESLSYATSLESGMLDSGDGLTFTITDFDNYFIEYMRYVEDPDTVAVRLSPRDDPAPSDLLDLGGNTINILGRFVNHEAIGQLGERKRFQVFPGDPMPGDDHAAFDGMDQSIAPSAVYDAPTALDGRRAALYRIYRDIDSSAEGYAAWPGWSLQYASGQSLIWYGTVTKHTARANVWKMVCDGPSSWLRKQLNVNRPTEWLPVSVPIGYFDNRFALEFRYESGSGFPLLYGASSYWDPVDDVIPEGVTALGLLQLLNARVQALASTPGPDITYSAFYNADAEITHQGDTAVMRARIDADTGFDYAGQWTLTMAEYWWLVLGFDVYTQNAVNYNDQFQIRFTESVDYVAVGTFAAAAVPADLGPQVTALIQTVGIGNPTPSSNPSAADNNGAIRQYKALTPFGTSVLSPAGTELTAGIGSSLYIEGQTKRGPSFWNFSNGGGTSDTTGYFALRGTYATPKTPEGVRRVEIIKGSWRDDNNKFGTDAFGNVQLRIDEFIDPRWFGLGNRALSFNWLVNDLEMCPVAIPGYIDTYGDRADLLLLTTMLSTGTSYLTGPLDLAVRTPGTNSHPDAVYSTGNDNEIADLGLGIYHSLIDYQSFVDTANELPGGGFGALNRCKYAFVGDFDSQEMIARILAPRAWSMGFINSKFSLFSRPQILDFTDAATILGPDDFASDDLVFIESVDLQPLTPKDKFKMSYGAPLLAELAPDQEIEPVHVNARDPGSRTRHSNAEMEIDGQGLIPYTLWAGKNPGSAWESSWNQLWGQAMALWYGSPYLMVKNVRIHHSKGRNLGPGSIVRFESIFGPSREGEYPLSNKVGRVTRVEHNLENLTTEVEILLQPGEATSQRRFAPIAQVLDMVATVEDRHDDAARTLYCYRDAFAHGGPDTLHDLRWFEEPAGLGIGGAAKVYGWQWDGRTLNQTFSFEVENVNLADDSITYVDGTFGGTFHEAQPAYLLLAPYDEQTPSTWPRAIFSVVTGSDLKFGVGPTKGFKLV